jgi:hypothetical protein
MVTRAANSHDARQRPYDDGQNRSVGKHARRHSLLHRELGAALGVAGVVAAAAATGKWEVVVGIACSIMALMTMIRYPRVHWLLFFGIMPAFFRQGDAGVSLFDAAMAGYLALLLIGWWIYALAARREDIVWERKDAFFLAVLLATVASSVVAVSRGADLLNWAREWALVAMGAFYFVFRSIFQRESDFRYYVFLLVVLSASLAIWAVFNIRQQVFDAIYAYQIRGVKGVNAVYLIGFFLSVSLYLYRQRWWEQVLWAIVASVIASGIVISLTRTIWIGTAAALCVMVVLVPWKQRRRLVTALVIVAAGFFISAQVVLGPSFPVVMKLLANRAISVKSGAKVASLIERRDESLHLLNLLGRPEIATVGIGPANEIVYYDSYLGTTVRSHFQHNGLLGLLIKFGIPIGVCIYGFHLAMVLKSVRCYIRSRNTRWEPYVLPFTLSLIGTSVMDWTTNAFMIRSGMLFLAMLYAGVAIVDRLLREDACSVGKGDSVSGALANNHRVDSGRT